MMILILPQLVSAARQVTASVWPYSECFSWSCFCFCQEKIRLKYFFWLLIQNVYLVIHPDTDHGAGAGSQHKPGQERNYYIEKKLLSVVK